MTARSLAWPLALVALAVGASPAAAGAASPPAVSQPTRPNPWRLTFRENGRAILTESGGRGCGRARRARLPHRRRLGRATRVAQPPRGSALNRARHQRPAAPARGTDRARRRGRHPRRRGGGGPGLRRSPRPGSPSSARGGRALPRLRRALQRRRPARREVENYVSDGPYQRTSDPFLIAASSRPGLRDRDDATYFPMPWLLSSAGYGVLVDDNETSLFRLGTDHADAWSVEAEAPARSTSGCSPGPRPADALRRFTAPPGASRAAAAPLVLRALVPAHRRRRAARSCDACAPPTSGLGRPDLHALPALRRPAGQPRRAARAHGGAPRRRAGGHHLLQPDGLHRLRRRLRPGRRGRRC